MANLSPELRAELMARTRETVATARSVMLSSPAWADGAVVLFLDRDGNLHCGGSATNAESSLALKRAIDAIKTVNPSATTLPLPEVGRG